MRRNKLPGHTLFWILAAVMAWLTIDLSMAITSQTSCDMTILPNQGWVSVLKDLDTCGYRTGITMNIAARTSALNRLIGRPRPGLLHCGRDLGHCMKRIAHTRILAVDVEPGMTAWEVSERIARAFRTPDYIVWDLIEDPIFAAQAKIKVHKHVNSPFEGYLGPGLYRFDSGMRPSGLLKEMAGQTIKRAKSIKPRGMSIHSFLTLASMVQKEGSRPADMARIARVFLNRLRLGMPLQSDPTMAYLPYGFHTRPCPALRRDKNNPYNTYAHTGLPPGPICSVGIKAMKAVAVPYNGPDAAGLLYFVAKGDGTHKFSRTFKEHKRAVRRFLRRKRGSGR